MKQLAKTGHAWITVGVHAEDTDRKDGGNMALVASANEFGTADGRIPARSFLRSTIDTRRRDILAVARKTRNAVIDRKLSGEDGLNVIAQWVEAAIKKTIEDLKDPPNAPSTIARKGSDNPLIDTGQLINSIRGVVHLTGRRPK